jgi:hypothetical protein
MHVYENKSAHFVMHQNSTKVAILSISIGTKVAILSISIGTKMAIKLLSEK